MKVYIYRDDWYCYGIDTTRQEVEVPDELIQQYCEAYEAFRDAQGKLAKYSCE